MIYLEGTDGVGKTTTAARLKERGIDCADRHLDIISKYMLFDVPMDIRVEKYIQLLKQDVLIIFMINDDREELERRIKMRSTKHCEFDDKSYEYNCLYKETYEYMESHDLLNGRLIKVNVTDLNITQSADAVYNAIQ